MSNNKKRKADTQNPTNDCDEGLVHPVILDESSLFAVLTPGKSGGTFNLPLGAKLKIPAACLGKKDSITCQVASPNTRWLTCPHFLPSNEHITSEIFTVKTSAKSLKKNVVLLLPFQPAKHEFEEINVKGRWTEGTEWVNVGFLIKDLGEAPCVELDISCLGTFVVTITPKKDTFEVSKVGCLHQSRLMRQLTIRFPKNTVDQETECVLQITPIRPDKIQLTRDQFPQESADLVTATEFIDVVATPQCRFRHPVSVKLPLPVGIELNVEGGGAAATREGHPDIHVLCKTTLGWDLIESNYKFTRNTIAFDARELTRYCVVQCIPGRHKKMKEAVALLEGRSNKEKGEICLFLSMKNKSWFALIEIVSQRAATTRISDRKSQGFTLVQKRQAPMSLGKVTRINKNSIPATRTNMNQKEDTTDIYESLTWLIDVDGDIKISMDSDLRENNQLRYFSRLDDSYRTFFFEPLENENRALEGSVILIPVGIREERMRNALTLTFDIAIDATQVTEFFRQETVPEEIKPEIKKDFYEELKTNKSKESKVPSTASPKIREISPNVLKRLTQLNKPIRVPDRESKAISGKSLMTLARLIPEGLTLAVHLHLPDSTITGIGFDALSNNLNMSDVSYKILLHWKRKCKDKRTDAVTQLIDALNEMNYPDIAAAILHCHQHSKDFTPDSLSHTDIYSRITLK
ncbi:hypothetical protein Btru_003406 [Bulinus truncatus]|nr:hypothetical protein Btru_003406 [Bulinus truncatus]